ncbi:hypothetical protein BJ508DRAFT_42203 [Ascobolus immersus RN42]|uniref:Uncharacterized protein n=1 Tax=Ascobolus immersus RN42 TaxID=1160509 RepID=A0A3N4IDI3_ASCIM|nr:hypothetical protein BJ508DRAFT_42203 [Ascobolus immersus RN42]
MIFSILLHFLILFSGLCCANVEKAIFMPEEASVINYNGEFSLSPEAPVVSISLDTAFITSEQPKGLTHWGVLKGLNVGQRYEIRVCWAATSPGDFYFNLYTPKQIVSVPNHPQQNLISETDHHSNVDPTTADLVLELSAVASYFSTNKTRMASADPVHVQLILDPFLFNILPQSLLPTVIYLVIVGLVAILLSGVIYNKLESIANGTETEAARKAAKKLQ